MIPCWPYDRCHASVSRVTSVRQQCIFSARILLQGPDIVLGFSPYGFKSL